MRWGVGETPLVGQVIDPLPPVAPPVQGIDVDDEATATGDFFTDADKVINLVQKISRTLKDMGITSIGGLNLSPKSPPDWNYDKEREGIDMNGNPQNPPPTPPQGPQMPDQDVFNAGCTRYLLGICQLLESMGQDRPIVELLANRTPSQLRALLMGAYK